MYSLSFLMMEMPLWQANELLTKHGDCMRDEVNCCAASKEHNRQNAASVEVSIKGIKRGSPKNQKPSGPRHLVLAHSHTHDLVSQSLKGDARDAYSSLTLKRKPRKVQKEMHLLVSVPVPFALCLCCCLLACTLILCPYSTA